MEWGHLSSSLFSGTFISWSSTTTCPTPVTVGMTGMSSPLPLPLYLLQQQNPSLGRPTPYPNLPATTHHPTPNSFQAGIWLTSQQAEAAAPTSFCAVVFILFCTTLPFAAAKICHFHFYAIWHFSYLFCTFFLNFNSLIISTFSLIFVFIHLWRWNMHMIQFSDSDREEDGRRRGHDICIAVP